jgi:hypothetical protein
MSVTWPEVTSVIVRKCVLRMHNRKLCHIRLSVAFWPEVTKSRDRKRHCPEVALTGSRFCACPTFPRIFFLVVVTWLPDVTECHLTPFGVPLDVRMRKRKLRNTCSDRRSCDPLEVFLWCSLRRPRPNGSDVTSVTGIGSMLCTCATGSCAISVLVGPFDRKWQSHVTERALTGSMFCAFPAFSRVFFLSSSNMATLGSCATPIMTEGHVIPSEVFSTTSASYNHRKTPRPIFIMVTGSIPGYLPLLFSHSVYIGCVVLLLC